MDNPFSAFLTALPGLTAAGTAVNNAINGPQATPGTTPAPQVNSTTTSGAFITKYGSVLLIGGGVIVAGIVGFLLFRRKS